MVQYATTRLGTAIHLFDEFSCDISSPMKQPKKIEDTNPYYALDDLGNFGSQDPALRPTAEDFAAISCFIREQKQQRAAEAAANQPAHPRRKTAA